MEYSFLKKYSLVIFLYFFSICYKIFSFISDFISFGFLFLLINSAKDLSILLIFSKNQVLDS